MQIKTKTVDAKAGDNGSIAGYAATWTRGVTVPGTVTHILAAYRQNAA